MNTLVIGGCTLTSCLRISSISIAKKYPIEKLRLIIDLSISGAREDNYLELNGT